MRMGAASSVGIRDIQTDMSAPELERSRRGVGRRLAGTRGYLPSPFGRAHPWQTARSAARFAIIDIYQTYSAFACDRVSTQVTHLDQVSGSPTWSRPVDCLNDKNKPDIKRDLGSLRACRRYTAHAKHARLG